MTYRILTNEKNKTFTMLTLLNATTMLKLAPKLYPLVNTWIVFNTVNNLSEGISRTVDGIIAPKTTSANCLLRFIANHGVSIPFRMVGGAIRKIN